MISPPPTPPPQSLSSHPLFQHTSSDFCPPPPPPFTRAPQWPDGFPINSAGKFAGTSLFVAKNDIDFRETGGATAIHPQIALIGLPDDLGVRLNHGRFGANEGPTAFRHALSSLGAALPVFGEWPVVFDAGDVIPGDTLDETHDRVTAATAALLDAGMLPIAVGGGHDLTFPFVRAVSVKFSPLSGLYFDAHLDVRETVGSGMAFRRLLETGSVCPPLELHGLRLAVNSRIHHDWFVSHGGTICPDDAPVILPSTCPHLFASFDLDVIDAAYAPGVSAMNPCGWTSREAERWVFTCGADSRVRCFDLMELSPVHDENGRTARLAAHLFLTFLRGFASRLPTE